MSILRRLVTSFGDIRMVNRRRTYCQANGPVVPRSPFPHRVDVSGRLNIDTQPPPPSNNTVGWAQVIVLLIAGSMISLWSRKNYLLESQKHAYQTSKDTYHIWRDLAEDKAVVTAAPSQSAAAPASAPPTASAAA